MEVYIVCEDRVTELIIRRLLALYIPNVNVLSRLPARGGQLKNKQKIESFNNLAVFNPVIFLIDLDASDCAPQLKNELLRGVVKNDKLIFNIAVDEAEAWLMADRDGFASYFGINVDDIPLSTMKRYNGPRMIEEMEFVEKPSLFLTHQLALGSSKKQVIEQLGSNGDACKGKEYNYAIEPFISEKWNVEEAMKNSDSLRRMIRRLQRLNENQ